MLAGLLDLMLPLHCGGCGAEATRWCDTCASALALHTDAPQLLTPRLDPAVPVFALGRYAGARRNAIVELKERGRTDLAPPLARALAEGIHRLLEWGILDIPLTVVPAPSRSSSARKRGGDPVRRLAQLATAHNPDLMVSAALKMRLGVRDSVGLDSTARQRNIAGKVAVTATPRTAVLLIDDIVTTGATAAESVSALQSRGVAVLGVLALAHA